MRPLVCDCNCVKVHKCVPLMLSVESLLLTLTGVWSNWSFSRMKLPMCFSVGRNHSQWSKILKSQSKLTVPKPTESPGSVGRTDGLYSSMVSSLQVRRSCGKSPPSSQAGAPVGVWRRSIPKWQETQQVICGDGVRTDGSLQAQGFGAVASDALSKSTCLLLHYSNLGPVLPAWITVCPPPLPHFLLQVQSLCQTTTCNHLAGLISA